MKKASLYLFTSLSEAHAFSFYAPTLWNTLPNSLKSAISVSSFKAALKNIFNLEVFSLN